MKLYADAIGTSLPLCVFLHGLLGDGTNLRRLATECTASHGSAMLLDLRNHGRSPHAPEMDWQAMARDVMDTLSACAVDQFHIVGHSLGGKVAMAVAEYAPERVRSLAVLDIAPVSYAGGHEAVFAGLESIAKSPPESRAAARQRLLQWLSEPAEVDFLLKNLTRVDSGKFRLRCNLDAIVAAYPVLCSSPVVAHSAYHGPVCFLKGEQSSYIDDRASAAARCIYPQSTQVSIAGAGHWLHFEQPAAVAAALNAFWSDQAFSKS